MSPPKREASVASPQQLVPPQDRAGEKAAFASEAYNKVARAAQLQGIILIRSNSYVLPAFLTGRRTGENPPKLSYTSTIENVQFEANEGVASCEWKWTVTGRTGRKKSLSIEATYLLIYDELTGCEADPVERFLRRVGRFASYPYFRAHVSQISWESGANLPILPTIST